jgi:hypothetical protein
MDSGIEIERGRENERNKHYQGKTNDEMTKEKEIRSG